MPNCINALTYCRNTMDGSRHEPKFNSEKGISKNAGKMEKYIAGAKFQEAFETFRNSDDMVMYSPDGLEAYARKAWHDTAQSIGFYSMSAGDDAHRHVIVSKLPFEKSLSLSTTAQKNFREDFGLKINLTDCDDFEYYVDMYGARDLLEATVAAVRECSSEFDFMTQLGNAKKAIWNDLKTSDGFAKYSTIDVSLLTNETIENKKRMNICNHGYTWRSNHGKYYVSIDLRSANFTSLRMFAPMLFHGAIAWDMYLDIVFECAEIMNSYHIKPGMRKYIDKSKTFRQKVFWEFDNARQSAMWEFIICKIAMCIVNLYPEVAALKTYHIGDEIVFELDDFARQRHLFNLDKVPGNIMGDYMVNDVPFRVKFFQLERIFDDRDWFVKKYICADDLNDVKLDGSFDIMCCTAIDYAVAWKYVSSQYTGEELIIYSRDLKHRYDAATSAWVYGDLPAVLKDGFKC